MEQFRFKPESELEKQVKATESVVGQELPQSSTKAAIFEMSAEELKAKYPKRYEIYVETLRKQRSGEAISLEETARMREWLRMLNNLDAYIENHKSNGARTLREKQLVVFEEMRNLLERGGSQGYVKLPTGVGKTVLFTEFLEALGTKTLIAVPTKTLLHQTVKKLKQFAPTVGAGKVYEKAKEFGKDVIVTTYASLVRQIEKGTIKPEEFGLIILDEAHRSLSDQRADAVGEFTNAIKLGFTATPEFSENKKVADLLNTEIYAMSIEEAVKESLLSSFAVTIARTSTDISRVKVSGGDYSEKELEKAINIESRNLAAVKLYKEAFQDRLGVAFCVGVSHAKQVAKLFNEQAIPAAVVVGNTKGEEEILERYARGEIKVL